MSEERYETVELIVQARTDGQSWFDIIFDLIAGDCEGSPGEELPDGSFTDGDPCTCGLESMGGGGGTLEQCYERGTTVGSGLQPIDLARVIIDLNERRYNYGDPAFEKVIEWAHHEVEFEAFFDNIKDDEDEQG